MNYKQAIEALDLSNGFSNEELQKNYKLLAKKYHPDNRVTGDEQRFILLGEAYDFLSNYEEKESKNIDEDTTGAVCPRCQGKGKINEKRRANRGMIIIRVECPFCNGSGKSAG